MDQYCCVCGKWITVISKQTCFFDKEHGRICKDCIHNLIILFNNTKHQEINNRIIEEEKYKDEFIKRWKRDPEFPCDSYCESEKLSMFADCETDSHYLCARCMYNVHRIKD